MQSDTSIHTDKPSGSLINFVNMVIVVVLVVMGVVYGDPVPVVLGVAMGLFIWFTRHNKYEVYRDKLVIYYGQPRQRIIPLGNISDVQTVLGGKGVFVRQKKGGGLLLRPGKVDEFQSQLEGARRKLGG